MRAPYRGYNVLAKWRTPSYNEATRQALSRRLQVKGPRFFSAPEFRLLQAVTARLIPQPDRAEPIPVAALLDDYLAEGRGGGYRLEDMPPLQVAWRQGLAGVDAEARRRHEAAFVDLAAALQDAVLHAVQTGDVDPAGWGGMSAAKFFETTLLKMTAGLYYAHPVAWSEIGFGGPASPRGYVRMGAGERDPWEAEEVG